MLSYKYHVRLTLVEEMLGTVPKNPQVFKDFVQSKALEKGLISAEEAKAEVATVEKEEERGWTGFMQDDNGLFIYNYVLRGFLKAASKSLKDQLGLDRYKSKLSTSVFVDAVGGPGPNSRRIYLTRDGKNVTSPDSMFERPLRSEDGPGGPRTALLRSDLIEPGTQLAFQVEVIADCANEFNEDSLTELFNYGRFSGLGQFRNGGFGRFVAEVTPDASNKKTAERWKALRAGAAEKAAAKKSAKKAK